MKKLVVVLLLSAWCGPVFALGGGGGGSAIPGVTVTNMPSATNQCLTSTSVSTAQWQSCAGGGGTLPSIPGTAGQLLTENASAAVWMACSGDATCSAVTPGAFTVVKLQGNPVKSGTPTNAQFYVYNTTNVDLEPVSLSGDVTMTNAGVATVGSTHITGAVNNELAAFTATGNLTNYAGSSCSNQAVTGLSVAGATACATITSNYVDTSIATTGGDINTNSPSSVVTTHIAGASPGAIVKYTAGGGLTNATAGSDYAPATNGTAILKGNNLGGFTNAVAKIDYAPATTGTSILKGDNLGGFTNAVVNTDYGAPTTGSAFTPVFADGAGGTIPGTRSGNTTEIASFTGAATPGRCLHLDANGNASIATGDCGVGTGFINTPAVTPVSGNAIATALAQCTAAGCTDYNRIANGANTGTLTLTTPASSNMGDGEELSVEVDNDGTHQPSSITWAAGTGVTLAYGNLGAAITAATCGTAAATGYEMYNWLWNATTGKLTLHDCGPVPAASTLGIALGGTGASSAAGARSSLAVAASGSNSDITSLTGLTTPLPVNEGGTAANTAAGALTSLGAPPSGVDVNSSGQVTATHLASALPVAQGGTGQTTLTSGAPLFGTGTSGITQGTLSGTGTELATFSGAATASRCLHTDASGNVTIAAGDCTTGTAATPGFINTPTVTTGATNLGTSCGGGTCMQCAVAGCTDYERVANGANVGALTITTGTKAQMTDGEELAVEVDTDGTHAPTSIAWTAGTNVTLAYGNLGAGSTTTSCPPPTATGQELYRWQWNGSTTPGNLTLKSCQPIPAATNLSVALGGTQCSATTIGTLPVSPPSGTTCLGITNAASCTAGTAVSTTGSTPCPLSYVNGAWYPALGALSAAGAGFTTAGTGLSAAGSTVSLTSPVAVANGGTNATAAGATAAHNIGAAAEGANSDITSLTGLSTPLSVAQGGTGGTTQSTATANNIGAAGKGANSDITSLSGLTTALSVAQGGTGQTSLTANAPLFGNGTGGIAQGSISGNTLEVASFSGAATAAKCLHTDSNGNVTVASTDCTAVSAPGFVNTPVVTPSGGNSTTTFGVQCGGVGCVDFEKVANASNAGTLTMSPPVATTMVTGELMWVYVIDSGTAPSDILLGAAPTGVTYQSYVIGLTNSDLTTTGAAAAKKRANACGAPQANAVLIYQFWWDGTNFNFTGCGETPSASSLPVAIGGTGSTVGSLYNALQIANDATTGTTADKLVSLTAANPAKAIITSAGANSGVMGICDATLGTCSTSGTAVVVDFGDHNCVFDASGATAGHYVGVSTVTSGACADVGAMPAGGVLVIGRVYANCAAAADCKISFLSPADVLNNGGVSSAVTFNTLPNSSSPGTAMNKLALISSSQVQTIGTTATSGIQGICTANCGTSSPNPTIQVIGAASCSVAGSTTPGDYAQADPSNAGDCIDGGPTFPTTGNEVVGTFLSTASGGIATVMLWGPDVANSSGGGGGGIAAGTVGNPAYYSASNTVSPIPNVIHITASGSDLVFKAQTTACRVGGVMTGAPKTCNIVIDPGVTDTEHGPVLLGYPNNSSNSIDQTLTINSGTMDFAATSAPFPQDDGLILAARGHLYCHGPSGTDFSIKADTGGNLNSLVTTLLGVVLQPWEASTNRIRGEFAVDSTDTHVVRIIACSGTCTTGGTQPTFSNTQGGEVTENSGANQITWETVLYNSGATRLASISSSGVRIEGCIIGQPPNNTAQINNTLRLSGLQGYYSAIHDVAVLGNTPAPGSEDQSGSAGMLIGPSQNNSICTANLTPLDCCTGNGTGKCQATGGGTTYTGVPTCCTYISALYVNPNGGTSTGSSQAKSAAYMMRINGASLVSIDGGQIGDLLGGNWATALLSIDGGASNVSMNNMYFENVPNNNTGFDFIRLNNAKGIRITNVSNCCHDSPLPANSVHILGGSSSDIFVKGEFGDVLTATNVLTNSINGTVVPALASGNSTHLDYTYKPASNAVTLIDQGSLSNGFGPGPAQVYYNAASMAIPACTASNERQFTCVSDSTPACTAGNQYDGHTGGSNLCLVECNSAGTHWMTTGVSCQ